MKKLLFIALIGYGGWYSWQHQYLPWQWASVDANGNPLVQVFTGPNCGTGCAEAKGVLMAHGVKYEEIYLATQEEGRQHDVLRYPLIRAGGREVEGSFKPLIVSMLAETYGEQALTPMERSAMRGHFGADGKPIVVVYGADWCGYCKSELAMLKSRGVAHVWVDVEKSPTGRVAYDVLQGAGYPTTYVGYRRIRGYNEAELQAAISELM